MRRLTLAIGAGIAAVVYAEFLIVLPIAAACVLVASVITRTDGVQIDFEECLAVAEILLLGGALIHTFWVPFLVASIIVAPILAFLFLLTLAVPYPRLPRR